MGATTRATIPAEALAQIQHSAHLWGKKARALRGYYTSFLTSVRWYRPV